MKGGRRDEVRTNTDGGMAVMDTIPTRALECLGVVLDLQTEEDRS